MSTDQNNSNSNTQSNESVSTNQNETIGNFLSEIETLASLYRKSMPFSDSLHADAYDLAIKTVQLRLQQEKNNTLAEASRILSCGIQDDLYETTQALMCINSNINEYKEIYCNIMDAFDSHMNRITDAIKGGE